MSSQHDNPFKALNKAAFPITQEKKEPPSKPVSMPSAPVEGDDATLFSDCMYGVTRLSSAAPLPNKSLPTTCLTPPDVRQQVDAAEPVSATTPSAGSLSDALSSDNALAKVRGFTELQEKHSPKPLAVHPATSDKDERKILARQRSRQAVEEQQTLAASKPVLDDATLFAHSMQNVRALTYTSERSSQPPKPALIAKPADPSQALQDILDGTVEFSLEYSDEFLRGHVVGADPLILHRLQQGYYSPEKHVDLHGLTSEQAYTALVGFTRNCYQQGVRTALIVTGRGKNSPNGVGVLRQRVQEWFTKEPFRRVVFAFCTALPRDGGPGALYILLRKMKKKRGKIQWDCPPPDSDMY